MEELRPNVVVEWHITHFGHDALERQTHREIAGIDDLVGSTGVGVVDDARVVMLRSEGRG